MNSQGGGEASAFAEAPADLGLAPPHAPQPEAGPAGKQPVPAKASNGNDEDWWTE